MSRPVCACGCGEFVTINQHNNCWNKFVHGHHMRTAEGRKRAKANGTRNLIKYNKSQAHRDYAREQMIRLNNTPGFREKLIEASRGKPRPIKDPLVKRAKKKKMQDLWKDDEWVDRMMEARRNGLNVFPNVPETIVDELSSDKVRYVGDGAWWRRLPNGIAKNPDFKVTGQKKVIEVFGEYWHDAAEAEMIIEMFHRIGYECLVLWESNIKLAPDIIDELIGKFIGE
jgi:hypothetical protein